MSREVLVVGASRGIGEMVVRHLLGRGDTVWSAARSPAQGRWIQADVGSIEGVDRVAGALAGRPLDALLYMGGTWETGAFSGQFDFFSCSDDDMRRVLDVNLLAPMRLAQRLRPQLAKAANPKIVLMGALSGLDNLATDEVANTASKFGLRGVAQALRRVMRNDAISVTVINPGNVATPQVLAELSRDGLVGGPAIPPSDLLACIDLALTVSRESCVKEINVAAMRSDWD